MILEFISVTRSTYGARKYLEIDTDKKTYSTTPRAMIPSGYKMQSRDISALIEQLKKEGYKAKLYL